MHLPKSLNDAWHALTRVPQAAENAVEQVPDAIGEGTRDVLKLGRYLKDHAPDAAQIKRTLSAVKDAAVSGESTAIQGRLPDYSTLDPAELAAARARGEGRTIAQPFITHDQAGEGHHEPISMTIRGSLDDLARALESQGWTQAPALGWQENLKMGLKVLLGTEKNTNGPVSHMYVNGHVAVAAFNKNDDYNAGRDHLRVFSVGTDPKTGEAVWQVAATRDVAASVTIPHPTFDGLVPNFEAPRFGHRTDPAIDHERDLIMHDLLASGAVKTWAAVDGVRTGVSETRLPDGRAQIGNRVTDGRVYEVSL